MVPWLKAHVVALVALLLWTFAHAQTPADFSAFPRMALVVGNDRLGTKTLSSVANDTRLMSDVLTEAGFKVQRKSNITHLQFEDTVTEFARQAAHARAFSVVYLSGLGTAVHDSIRFFGATEKSVVSEDDVYRNSSALAWVLAEMALWRRIAGSTAPVVLVADIDTTPWLGVAQGKLPNAAALDRSLRREAATAVILPNAIGASAYESDDGKHALFTQHLADAFAMRGTHIGQIFERAATSVRRHPTKPMKPEMIVNGLKLTDMVFVPAVLPDDPKARGRSARVQ